MNFCDSSLWDKLNRTLLAKMIREFHYEGLLEVRSLSTSEYEITPSQSIRYLFNAKISMIGELIIDETTLKRFSYSTKDEKNLEDSYTLTAMQLLLDLYKNIEMKEFTTTYFIEELQRTLLSDILHYNQTRHKSWDEIFDHLHYNYAYAETLGMGHPWLVVSKGRLGFSALDDKKYTPESQNTFHLYYLAISKKFSRFISLDDENQSQLIENEISRPLLKKFLSRLPPEGFRDYDLLPIHPWQWDHIGVTFFQPLMSQNDLIFLGESEDQYLPQQAIRTLSNISNPKKNYLKLTLNIFNTAVFRGIPQKRAYCAPYLTKWLKTLVKEDPYLKNELRVGLLGEVSSLTISHPYFDQLTKAPYQYHESLAVIWRESVESEGILEEGETAIGLTALLFINSNNQSYIQELINRSGYSAEKWLEIFHRTVLHPLLHFLHAYGVAFNAHGQNLILVLKNYLPTRLIIKDFSDDVNILKDSQHIKLPIQCRGIILEQEPSVLMHFIFTSLFICYYRYLVQVLKINEKCFWNIVRQEVLSYQNLFPQFSQSYEQMNFLKKSIPKVCLNRVRALTFGYHHDFQRPEPSLWGDLENPLFFDENES